MSTKNPFGSGVELMTSNEEGEKTNEKRAKNRRHTEKIMNNFQRLIDKQGMNEYNNFRNVREEISNNSMSFLKDEIDALKGRVAKMEYDIRRLKTVKSGKNKNKPKTQKI
uniref:Uncharacterized protein n=1 Tax=viral metagenome TaxID=1070528 RepID=A0A6C0L1S9_9ZZZZ|tara:strand:+ start:16538 stop:16867 length:330 start_codon:yes stop_codon:yes gene_type:complete